MYTSGQIYIKPTYIYIYIYIYYLIGKKVVWVDIACTSVRPYFYEPQASENTAQECNIQPYYLLNHQIIYTTLILVAIDSYCACAVQRSLLRAYLIRDALCSQHFENGSNNGHVT